MFLQDNKIVDQLYCYSNSTNSLEEFASLVLEMLFTHLKTDRGAIYLLYNESLVLTLKSEAFDFETSKIKELIKKEQSSTILKDDWCLFNVTNKNLILSCLLCVKDDKISNAAELILKYAAEIIKTKYIRTFPKSKLLETEIKNRKQIEKDFEKQAQLYQLVANLATSFVNVPVEEMDRKIQQALSIVAKFLNINYACLFYYVNNLAVKTHNWCNIGFHIDNLKVDVNSFIDIFNAHQQGKIVYFPQVGAKNNKLCNLFLNQGIQSLLFFPMMNKDKCTGFITFGSKKEKRYKKNEIRIIKILVDILVNAQIRHKNQEAIRKLSLKISRAYEEERRRLARELHDEISQALTVIKLEMQRANANANIDLTKNIELINQTINSIRHHITSLRPPILEETSLIEAINDLAEELICYTNISIKINENISSGVKIPKDIELAIYRCAQESITNAIRHAEASHVIINLSRTSYTISLEVIDNGKGFDYNSYMDKPTKHLGLIGMQERVALLKGKMKIDSKIGVGTKILIEIPVGDFYHENIIS